MEALNAWIFALFCFFQPNPSDPGKGYEVPIPYSLTAYHAAALYPTVDPGDVVSWLIAEHGFESPYRADSIGDGGRSLGLLQLTDHEIDAGAAALQMFEPDPFDPIVNIRIAAYTIAQHKRTHSTENRCLKLVERGGEQVKQRHTWHAHVPCGPRWREKCRTKGRERLARRLAHWRRYGVKKAEPADGPASSWSIATDVLW